MSNGMPTDAGILDISRIYHGPKGVAEFWREWLNAWETISSTSGWVKGFGLKRARDRARLRLRLGVVCLPLAPALVLFVVSLEHLDTANRSVAGYGGDHVGVLSVGELPARGILPG
jgi:hypothetical protein